MTYPCHKSLGHLIKSHPMTKFFKVESHCSIPESPSPPPAMAGWMDKNQLYVRGGEGESCLQRSIVCIKVKCTKTVDQDCSFINRRVFLVSYSWVLDHFCINILSSQDSLWPVIPLCCHLNTVNSYFMLTVSLRLVQNLSECLTICM